MTDLLAVDDALTRILARVAELPAEEVGLEKAQGRVLAEDIRAGIDLPPFANSSMDGYAVRAADVAGADAMSPVRLRLVMDIPAGSYPERQIEAGQAARIMTGAPMPEGADAVVPVEDTDSPWERSASADIPEAVGVRRAVGSGAYVRPVGEDIQRGTTVLTAGTVLRPQEIGVLAALGQARVQVIRKPRVVVLSSGDELVGVEQALTPGKIRDVNRFTLAGLVDDFGGQAIRLPIARDTLESVERMFTDALLGEPDMIISSAGVSVGAADLIRDVLGKLGEMNFWRINLRPGKPLAFGHLGDIPFFGLPGNPVSAMVTFYVLVRPALLKQAGRSDYWPSLTATLEEPLSSDGRRSYIRVKLRQNDNGVWLASTTGTQSSGALMSMVLADGLMVIPEGQTVCNIGDKFHVYLLRDRIE